MDFKFRFIFLLCDLAFKNVKNSNEGFAIPVAGCTKFHYYPYKKFKVTKISFVNSQVSIILLNENGEVQNFALFPYEIKKEYMIICAWEYLDEFGKIKIEMSDRKTKIERTINFYIGINLLTFR